MCDGRWDMRWEVGYMHLIEDEVIGLVYASVVGGGY